MPNTLTVLAIVAGSPLILMLVLYGVRRATGRIAVVDVGWVFGTGALGIFIAGVGTGELGRRLILGSLIGLWSLRLGVHLLVDRALSPREDGRYESLIAGWGVHAERKVFALFMAQAFFVVFFCLPLLPTAYSPRPLWSPWDVLALAVWVVAAGGEALADRQLARWRCEPANRGRTCRAGLWRYSRHPNYFFEWLHWWAYVLLAIGAPRAWASLIGPATMLLFLFRFTGIPYTEAQALRSRGADYAEYQQTTSVFIPWIPRRKA